MELRDITRSFPGPPEVQALKSVNLSVAAGDYVSIVGPSGSGKSTMLNILGLVDRPSVGEYHLGGELTANLDEVSRSCLRAALIGFVFQAFHLLPRRTVLENVMLPLELRGDRQARAKARAMLERVGLAERLSHRPAVLSGGEQQRVALARAFVMSPDILMADEPTGSLDHATGLAIMDLMFELNREVGTTLILVTHDPAIAARCQHTVRIGAGRITG